MMTTVGAVFDLAPQSPVLQFWQHSGPFDVYLKLAQIVMFCLVVALFVGGMLIPFQRVEPVPPEEISEGEQLAAYGEVICR
jgi:hypothetical protein